MKVRVIRVSVLLNVELVQRQLVHEGPYQVICGEVKDQAEKNGDWKGGESFFEDGQEEEGETQALQRQRQNKKTGTNTWNLCVPNKIKGFTSRGVRCGAKRQG